MLLECDPNSLAGPVDERCIRYVEQAYRVQLDSDYRALLPRVHGGVPRFPWFVTQSGNAREIGRLVPIVDEYSVLYPPSQPFAMDQGIDRRVYQSLEHILGRDSSCFGLSERIRLMPFAALVTNEVHPDALDHTNCECDFVCFDLQSSPQAIVLFRAADAATEYWRLEDETSSDELEVDYESFTQPVADNFGKFVTLLSDQANQTS